MIGVLATPISEELKNVRQPDKRKDIQGKLQRSYSKAINIDISIIYINAKQFYNASSQACVHVRFTTTCWLALPAASRLLQLAKVT